MLSLASSPSLRHHPVTHWPYRRTAETNSKHSWSRPPPCGSRNYQFPAPWSPSTVIRLPGDFGLNFQLPYSYKCSNPSTICRTQVRKQRRSWSHSVLCGQACRRIATPGHRLASAPKSPPHSYSIWQLYTVGSHFPSRPRRPHGAPSDLIRLHILPRRSQPFHSLAGSRPHPGHHNRHRGKRPTNWLDIPLQLFAHHHHRPGTSV
jgi:hypothetical protein